MVWHSPATLSAHAPGAHGASRAPHLCVPLVAHSASNFAGPAFCQGAIRFGSQSRRIVADNGLSLVFGALKSRVDRDHSLKNLVRREMLVELINTDPAHGRPAINLIN